jgi:hypothetical protein
MPKHDKYPASWMYTEAMRHEHGDMYLDRPLITRDSPINGGVYYGTYGGEAIVVDPENYPEQYDRYYKKATELASVDGRISRPDILNAVFDTVASEMTYSQDGVDDMLAAIATQRGLTDYPDGAKIELGAFMQKGVGVCRHQALVCAVMLEKFKKDGLIRGEISVDRNMQWNPRRAKHDGHAWARYTAQSGNVIILDVAQEYFGRLEDTRDKDYWNYLRPNEQEIIRATGRSGVTGSMLE